MPNNQFPPSTSKHPFFKIRSKNQPKTPNYHSLERKHSDSIIKISSFDGCEFEGQSLYRAKTEQCPTYNFHQSTPKPPNSTQELQRQVYRLKTRNVQFSRCQYSSLKSGQTVVFNQDRPSMSQLEKRKRLSYRPSPKTINNRLVQKLLQARFQQSGLEEDKDVSKKKQFPQRIHDHFSRMMSRLRGKKWSS